MTPIWYFVFYTMLTTGGMEVTAAQSQVYFFHDKEVCNTFRGYEIEKIKEMLPEDSWFGYSQTCQQLQFEGEKK